MFYVLGGQTLSKEEMCFILDTKGCISFGGSEQRLLHCFISLLVSGIIWLSPSKSLVTAFWTFWHAVDRESQYFPLDFLQVLATLLSTAVGRLANID